MRSNRSLRLTDCCGTTDIPRSSVDIFSLLPVPSFYSNFSVEWTGIVTLTRNDSSSAHFLNPFVYQDEVQDEDGRPLLGLGRNNPCRCVVQSHCPNRTTFSFCDHKQLRRNSRTTGRRTGADNLRYRAATRDSARAVRRTRTLHDTGNSNHCVIRCRAECDDVSGALGITKHDNRGACGGCSRGRLSNTMGKLYYGETKQLRCSITRRGRVGGLSARGLCRTVVTPYRSVFLFPVPDPALCHTSLALGDRALECSIECAVSSSEYASIR